MLKSERLRNTNQFMVKIEGKDIVDADEKQGTIRLREEKMSVNLKRFKEHVSCASYVLL